MCNDLTVLYVGAQQGDIAVLDDQVAMLMTSVWSKRNLIVSKRMSVFQCTHQLHQGHVCRVTSLGRQAFLNKMADKHCAMGSKQFMHDVCRLHGMHCAKNHAAGEM